METLRIIAAEQRYEGETYTFRKGPIPDDTPKAVVDALREQGALESSDTVSQEAATTEAFNDRPPRPHPTAIAKGGAEGEPASGSPDAVEPPNLTPTDDGGGGAPANAPDVESTSVADLAKFIDSESPNATQTVALAGDSPELAAKVLEAENLAHGGDGRKTVTVPLSKLADSGDDSGGSS